MQPWETLGDAGHTGPANRNVSDTGPANRNAGHTGSANQDTPAHVHGEGQWPPRIPINRDRRQPLHIGTKVELQAYLKGSIGEHGAVELARQG